MGDAACFFVPICAKGPSRESEVLANKRNEHRLPVIDEGCKRVIGIIAGILVARHLKTTEDLFDTRDSPRTRSMIGAAVQWAERIMKKIDAECSKKMTNLICVGRRTRDYQRVPCWEVYQADRGSLGRCGLIPGPPVKKTYNAAHPHATGKQPKAIVPESDSVSLFGPWVIWAGKIRPLSISEGSGRICCSRSDWIKTPIAL